MMESMNTSLSSFPDHRWEDLDQDPRRSRDEVGEGDGVVVDRDSTIFLGDEVEVSDGEPLLCPSRLKALLTAFLDQTWKD